MAESRVTQVTPEAIAGAAANARVTQVTPEAVAGAAANARATQVTPEAVAGGAANARATQVTPEAVAGGAANARVTQLWVEVVVPTFTTYTKAVTVSAVSTSFTTYTKSVTVSAMTTVLLTKSVTASAVVQATLTRAVTVTAVLQTTLTKAVTVSAMVATRHTKTVTVNAVIVPTVVYTKLVTVSAMCVTRHTKTVTVSAEIFAPVGAARITQAAVEALVIPTSTARTTQAAVEALASGNAHALTSALAEEVLSLGNPHALTSALAEEVLSLGNPHVVASYVALEVLLPVRPRSFFWPQIILHGPVILAALAGPPDSDPGAGDGGNSPDTDPIVGPQIPVSPTGGDDTTSIRNALAQVPTSGGALLFEDGTYNISDDIALSNYTNLTVTSRSLNKTKVTINMTGYASGLNSRDYYCFRPAGVVQNMIIKHLTINGVGNSNGRQTGIGNPSGVTASGMTFRNLTVKNVNVGMSFNADLAGSYATCTATYNYLLNIRGTAPGSGYGIHASNAQNLTVTNNTVDNAERHAIYCGKTPMGSVQSVLIADNTIKNHRKDVANGFLRAAISVSRSRNVEVARNLLKDGYDSALEISHESSTSSTAHTISVHNNTYVGRRNAVPYLFIGEQSNATGFTLYNINIYDEYFDSDETLYNDAAPSCLWLLNGTNVSITGCTFDHTCDGAGVAQSVVLGYFPYTTSLSNANNITCTGNTYQYTNATAGSRDVTLAGVLRYRPPAVVTLDVVPYIEP